MMEEAPSWDGDFSGAAEEQHTNELGVLQNVSEIAKEHEATNSNSHLPQLVWYCKLTNPTSAVQKISCCTLAPTRSSHVLYILLFHKLLPITQLRHGEDLFTVWLQCVLCHITLWKEGVYHRDVSPPNLMWYDKDGKLIGVLNDYDLSSLATEPGPRGNVCTGTVPFMALDLLTKRGQRGEVKHFYRHDLESFVWCFAWISLRYKKGVLRPRGSRPFDEWATSDAVACGNEKLSLQTYKEVPDGTRKNNPGWQFIKKCLLVLSRRQSSRSEQAELTQESELDTDMDEFLNSLKLDEGWAKLSNPSPAQ